MRSASRLVVFFAVLALFDSSLGAQAESARIVVNKKMPMRWGSGSPFAEVSSALPASAGFIRLSDHPSRTVFEGPANSAQSLLVSLRSEGYDARVASDIDEVAFRGHRIDPDTGAATPPFASNAYQPSGSRGLFILTLRSYPTPAWLSSLVSHGVRLVESLSPAAYVARIDRDTAATLKWDVNFVRGVFPVTPSMKAPTLSPPSSESIYRHVLVQAVEEQAGDSLRPYLDAYSERPPVEIGRAPNGRVSFGAWLADTDLWTLSHFEAAYGLVEFGPAAPSSERQGLLVLQPSIVSGRLELPAPLVEGVNDYYHLLTHAGTDLSSFMNTRIAILDTGFDDGGNTHPDFQFGGVPSVEQRLSEYGSASDDQGHGTFTASIITGFTSFNLRADSDKYRYSLGVAPGVKLISDRVFQCGGGDVPLETAIENVKAFSVDLMNLSWNERRVNEAQPNPCGYTARSYIVDWRTRKGPFLFTVSAGNTPDDPFGCVNVRGPATAKNGISVGATESFTPSSWPNQASDGVCAWNDPHEPHTPPVLRDGRAIPSFSARRAPSSLVKPDLVAPGVRTTGPDSRGPLCGSIYCTAEVQVFQPGDLKYGLSAGTSFAAPVVAGAAAVVRRWYYNLTWRWNPSPALVKAILINGARDIGGPPAVPPNCAGGVRRGADFESLECIGHIPNDHQGWGMLSFARLLGPSSNYYFSDQYQHAELNSSYPVWYDTLVVNDPARPIHLTLTYTDPPNSPEFSVAYGVKNDVDLRVYVPAYGHWWYGNSLDPATGQSRLNVFANDPVNNVERVIIPAGTYPAGTQFQIVAVGVSIVEHFAGFPPGFVDPAQDFVVVAENAR